MKILAIDAVSLAIPFQLKFRHAAAERARTQTLWVDTRTAQVSGCGEGCPREYVTGESLATARAFVDGFRDQWCADLHDLDDLRAWIAAHGRDIDANPAAWCAVELSLLDCLGKEADLALEALLGSPAPAGAYRYSAVLGDSSAEVFAALLVRYRQVGFTAFKIKLSGHLGSDLDKIRILAQAGVRPQDVRADANNLWRAPDDAIDHLRALQFPFWAVEEPLQAGDYAGLQRVGATLGTRIILDESFQRLDQLDLLPGSPRQWILNLRVSKLGGLLRSLHLGRQAAARGFELIAGAHVGETSVLTRAALTLAAQAGAALLGQEGAVGTHLLAHDVVPTPLMFGPQGVLDIGDHPCCHRPGLGLDVQLSPGDRECPA